MTARSEVRVSAEGEIAARIGTALSGIAGVSRPVHVVELSEPSLDDVRRVIDSRLEDEAVLVVLSRPPTPYVTRALLAGVEGVVASDDIETGLVPAVQALAVGLRVASGATVHDLRTPELSSREKQVLAMLVLDMSNSEIAGRLHVSESNVKFHLSSAFRKLGVRSRSAAAELILDPDAGLGPGILRITVERDQPQ